MFHVIVNANSVVQQVSQIKKDYGWNSRTCICENSKYLLSIAKLYLLLNTVSTKKTNTIATNVTSTASINCHIKKVRDCYILHAVLLVIILLLIIIITCYYYAKHFKIFRIQNRMCYYFDDIIKLEDFDLDGILIDKKSHENILIYVI